MLSRCSHRRARSRLLRRSPSAGCRPVLNRSAVNIGSEVQVAFDVRCEAPVEENTGGHRSSRAFFPVPVGPRRPRDALTESYLSVSSAAGSGAFKEQSKTISTIVDAGEFDGAAFLTVNQAFYEKEGRPLRHSQVSALFA